MKIDLDCVAGPLDADDACSGGEKSYCVAPALVPAERHRAPHGDRLWAAGFGHRQFGHDAVIQAAGANQEPIENRGCSRHSEAPEEVFDFKTPVPYQEPLGVSKPQKVEGPTRSRLRFMEGQKWRIDADRLSPHTTVIKSIFTVGAGDRFIVGHTRQTRSHNRFRLGQYGPVPTKPAAYDDVDRYPLGENAGAFECAVKPPPGDGDAFGVAPVAL